MSPEPLLTRRALEEYWRLRVEKAHAQYRKVQERHRVLAEQANGTAHDPNGEPALASQAESDALAKYARLLKAFTDLTIDGILPEDLPSLSSDSISGGERISIVDDDESIRQATRAFLRSAGYQVATFASAELFLEADAIRETDCLVLDVRMPGIDGFELQRRLNEAQSLVPIVFVTAHDDQSHRAIALCAGAKTFLHKPFEANVFLAAIQAALHIGTVRVSPGP